MPTLDRLALGSDHAGYEMKEFVKKELDRLGIPYNDLSPGVCDPADDFPVSSSAVARAVADGTCSRGIALCGTGIGASMAANRFRKVRAALCLNPEMARMARSHNNANILVLGGRITSPDTVAQILRVWFETPFAGGRHERRMAMLDTVC